MLVCITEQDGHGGTSCHRELRQVHMWPNSFVRYWQRRRANQENGGPEVKSVRTIPMEGQANAGMCWYTGSLRGAGGRPGT